MNLPTIQDAPSLTDYEPSGVELCPEYWTPETEGESKRLIFVGVAERRMPSAEDPEQLVDLPCAIFVQPDPAPARVIANGSKRLVGLFEEGTYKPATPFEITYLGKRKNSSNSFKSDAWSVIELKPRKGGE